MRKTLLWFRQDLRLSDNPMIARAIQDGDQVCCVYVYDDETPGEWAIGEAQKWWLHHSLGALQKSLSDFGHALIILKGRASKSIPEFLKSHDFDAVFWNRCYEPYAVKRDTNLMAELKDQGLEVKSFSGSLLNEPHVIKTGAGEPYKVFTPYWKRVKSDYRPRKPLEYSILDLKSYSLKVESLSIEDLDLLPKRNWGEGFGELWSPGEKGAQGRLGAFLKDKVFAYIEGRNLPSEEGTSRLSPHFHHGEISPHQVWHAAVNRAAELSKEDSEGLDVFLSEIVWREFSYNLLFHFPEFPDSAFRENFNHFPWIEDKENLRAWKKGMTGIPIVDAGMRQLWREGWMHNRVRMIVGSLLTKNLLIHWLEGERWFWDCLVDADLASNSAGWQWVAGSGADAQPYFRIFNPVSQGEKFDKDGDYVRKFVPELRDMPAKYIHAPWDAPENVLKKAGVTLGESYPKPIVDLKESRKQALSAYEEMKSNANA